MAKAHRVNGRENYEQMQMLVPPGFKDRIRAHAGPRGMTAFMLNAAYAKLGDEAPEEPPAETAEQDPEPGTPWRVCPHHDALVYLNRKCPTPRCDWRYERTTVRVTG